MSGMFGGGTVNPYDDIVAKTTDENLTTENWELILNLCDKVNDEGQDGARNVLAALLKRLAHRNPNVQLYTLTLAEALSKNCGIEVHRELASKAWTGGLERIVVDRNTHDKVRKRILSLIAMWTIEFESDETLGVMEDCYKSLSAKGYKFETPNEPPPPTVDDEIRRKEEEELQRVLEMSIQDKGGRGAWAEYTSYGSSYVDTAGASGSGSGSGSGSASRSNGYAPATGTGTSSYIGASGSNASNAPSRSQTVSAVGPGSSSTPGLQPTQSQHQPQQPQPQHQPYSTSISNTSTTSLSSPTAGSNTPIVTRVKALHTFTPTEPGELAFEKGDIIKVVDRGYRDWWRGQLRGRTGIFPVNYVEPLPEPTPTELAREAEAEAAVFAQAINVEKLLTLLRSFDPTKSNLADDEEIQELYRSSMALRPKIVKLIDKYSQKRADLVSMNETFLRARNIFDRMMEDSLARHTAVYSDQAYAQSRVSTYNALPTQRPDSRVAYGQSPGPGGPGWGPGQSQLPGYNAVGAGPGYAGAPHFPQPAYPQQQQQPPAAYGGYGPQQQQPQPQGQGPPQTQPQPYGQSPYPSQQHQHVPQQQPQSQPEQQPQYQAQPQQQQQQQQQVQTQPQTQAQPQTQQSTTHTQPQGNPAGPPYVYDPKATYADPNVQAWAQYYAQGGTDPTGSVYFISVPGVKEAAPGAPPTVSTGNEVQQQPQKQPQQQYQPQSQGQMQGQAQVQGGQQPQQQSQHQVYQQASPSGSVHSIHSVHSLHGGIIPGGRGGSSGSVDNLPNPYSGTGDASAGGNPGASGPGTVQRESSLPDPYANATAPAPSIVGGGPGPAFPTSPASTFTATGPVGIAPGPGSPTGLGSGPHTPTTPANPPNNALGAPSSSYNHPNTSQPSWLLPKMGSPPKSFHGAGEGDIRASSPQSIAGGHVGGGYGQSSLYHGIQGQMSGLSLNDGPPAGQGQPPQQGGYQGVGTTA